MARDVDLGFPPVDLESIYVSVCTINPVSVNGAGEAVNLFEVDGAIRAHSIIGRFTDVTDVSAVTACFLDLYDDDSKAITESVTGTDLSGVALNSMVFRNAAKDTALVLIDRADGVVLDGLEGSDWLAQFIAASQTGTSTYIRFNFTSDTGGYSFAIRWELRWQAFISGSVVTSQ